MGTVQLQASDDASSWSTLWSKSGNMGDAWSSASLSVDGYAYLRFYYVSGSGYYGDFALDDITVYSASMSPTPGPTPEHNDDGNDGNNPLSMTSIVVYGSVAAAAAMVALGTVKYKFSNTKTHRGQKEIQSVEMSSRSSEITMENPMVGELRW